MRHLKIYRAIRLIQREGSIRKAAERLAVSPSALNRSVQAFEDEMDMAVFERMPHGVQLTMAGELLLNVVDRHLTEFDDLQAQLTSLRDGLSGTLRLSVGTDIGAGCILDVLDAFQGAFRGVSVEITTTDDSSALQRRDVDLAILTTPATDDALEVMYAHDTSIAAWHCDPEKTQPDPADISDIVQRRLILPPEGSGTRIAISHVLRRKRLSPRITTTLPAAQLHRHRNSGPRICIFPDMIADDRGGLGPMTRLPFDFGSVQVSAIRAARVPLTRPVAGFMTLLQKRLEADQVLTKARGKPTR